jgi:hypothetical protein
MTATFYCPGDDDRLSSIIQASFLLRLFAPSLQLESGIIGVMANVCCKQSYTWLSRACCFGCLTRDTTVLESTMMALLSAAVSKWRNGAKIGTGA